MDKDKDKAGGLLAAASLPRHVSERMSGMPGGRGCRLPERD
jgi:hypothetical protein